MKGYFRFGRFFTEKGSHVFFKDFGGMNYKCRHEY